jgi:hypothetical protein
VQKTGPGGEIGDECCDRGVPERRTLAIRCGKPTFKDIGWKQKILKLSVSHCIGHSLPQHHRVFGSLFKIELRGVYMHRNVALLTRLEQIAAQPCPCEERTACALTLVKADIARLYARLGIGASNRIDSKAKSFADDKLADLRNRVLAAEMHTPGPPRPVFTAVRHRIEMIRRVLASRIAGECVPAPVPTANEALPVPHAHPYWVNPAWRFIPATGGAEFSNAPRLTTCDFHRARRARFGSLSGQLTM